MGRAFAWTLAAAVASAAAEAGNAAVGTIMIFVDDLRAEMGPYGDGATVKTPNLDRLASMGRTFLHAHTPIAICSPSRWATLSGLRPDRSKLWYIGPYLRETFEEGDNVTTLPQAFKEAGVPIVKGAGKVFHPGTSSGGPTPSMGGSDAPFSYKYDGQTTTHGYFWCDAFYNNTLQSPRSISWPNGTGCIQNASCIQCLEKYGAIGGPDFKVSWRSAPCDAGCFPDGAVADESEALIAEAAATAASRHPDAGGQSFLLTLGLKRPHLGWFAPQWAFDAYPPNGSIPLAPNRYPPKGMPEVAFYDNGELIGMHDVGTALVNDTSGYPLIVDWKQHESRRAYYATVTFMDSQLGRILDAVEANGLDGRVNLVFVGDHGYGLFEHGEVCKQTVFDTTTRVPLFFVGPGVAPGTVDASSLVSMLDIAPTLADLAGIDVPFKSPRTTWQGRSLRPLLQSPPPSTTPADFSVVFSQFPRDYTPGRPLLRSEAFAAGVGALPAAGFEGDLGQRWEEAVEAMRLGRVGNAMGLSMRTPRWRYTEWRPFNFTAGVPLWDEPSHGTELYDHEGDTGTGLATFQDFENVNLANDPEHATTVAQLSKQLRAAWNTFR